jgi:LEA14-like dessication related protein
MSRLCRNLVILLAITLAACAGIRPVPPEVQLSSLEITDISLSHANFLATLRLFNPNGVALDVEGVKFTLFLNDIRIANGQTAKALTLPAEESGVAAIRLSSSFFDLLQLTRELQNRSEITFRIVGEVKVGGYGLFGATIPIERAGTLPLSGSLNQLLPGTGQMLPLKQLDDPVLRQ